MVQLQAPYQLHGTFTQKKDAPLQRGEGARGLSGWLSNGPKAKPPGIGAARVSSAMTIWQCESSRHGGRRVTIIDRAGFQVYLFP